MRSAESRFWAEGRFGMIFQGSEGVTAASWFATYEEILLPGTSAVPICWSWEKADREQSSNEARRRRMRVIRNPPEANYSPCASSGHRSHFRENKKPKRRPQRARRRTKEVNRFGIPLCTLVP